MFCSSVERSKISHKGSAMTIWGAIHAEKESTFEAGQHSVVAPAMIYYINIIFRGFSGPT